MHFLNILGISSAVFGSVMSGSMLAIAFPDIARDLNVSFSVLLWRTVLFFSLFAGGIPFFGKLADRTDPRKQLLLGLALFLVGCLGSWTSAILKSWIGFLGFQLLTALADSIMVPAQVSLIHKTVEDGRTGWAFGIFSSVLSTGTLFGPAVGGVLIKYYGWPSIFAVLGGCSLVSLAMVLGLVQKIDKNTLISKKWKYFETLKSTILIIVFVASFQLPFCSTVSHQFKIIGGAVSLLSLFILFLLESRKNDDERLFPGKMFRNMEFRRACLRIFILFTVVNSIAIFLPNYMREVHKMDPNTTGLIIFAESTILVLLGGLSGRLADRVPFQTMFLGISISILSLIILTTVSVPTSILLFVTVYVLLGIGGSLSSPAQNKIAMSSAPKGEIGNYMGVFQFLQFVSGSFSAGAIGTFYSQEKFRYFIFFLISLQIIALMSTFLKRECKIHVSE